MRLRFLLLNMFLGTFFTTLGTSCSGIIGPHFTRVNEQPTSVTVEIDSYGLAATSVPSFHNATVGWHRTRLVFDRLTLGYAKPISAGYSFTRRLPDTPPLHALSATRGISLSLNPVFRGFAVGLDTHSFSMLPLDQGMSLEILPSTTSMPSKVTISHTQ